MLSCHEKGNHDVRDFMVTERSAITVFLIHQGGDHVRFVL